VAEILYKEECYRINGACFQVYLDKGCGFSESVYQECMGIEFGLQGIPFLEKPSLGIAYKGQQLQRTFEPDFVCYQTIIVELKAVSILLDIHRAQVHNYLKAGGYRLGLLVNFAHHPNAEIERIIR